MQTCLHGQIAQYITKRETRRIGLACSARIAVAQGLAGSPAGCTHMRGMGVDRYCSKWESCSRRSPVSLPSPFNSLPAPASCLQDLRASDHNQTAYSPPHARHHPLQHRCMPGCAGETASASQAKAMPPKLGACISAAQHMIDSQSSHSCTANMARTLASQVLRLAHLCWLLSCLLVQAILLFKTSCRSPLNSPTGKLQHTLVEHAQVL